MNVSEERIDLEETYLELEETKKELETIKNELEVTKEQLRLSKLEITYLKLDKERYDSFKQRLGGRVKELQTRHEEMVGRLSDWKKLWLMIPEGVKDDLISKTDEFLLHCQSWIKTSNPHQYVKEEMDKICHNIN